jgi:VWFA-related protein
MRSGWTEVCIFCLALLNTATSDDVSRAFAQSSRSSAPIRLIPRTKEQRDQNYRAEHSILLTAQVTDSVGKPLTGLTSDDFELLDNQKPQKISEFRELDASTLAANARVVVVLDGINDGGSAIGPLKKDLDKFLSQGSKPLPLPLSLAFISDVPKLVVQDSVPGISADGEVIETQPTTDRAKIHSSLAQLARHSHQIDCFWAESGASRSYCFAEHFTGSLNALMKILQNRQNTRGPTFLIWAGRGWPLVAERRGYYRARLVELNTDLRLAHVVLDATSSYGFEIPKRYPTPLPGTGTPDQDAERDMTLKALAIASGGVAQGKVRNFSDAIWKMVEEPSGLYSLSFDSTPSATADEYHSIELKVDRPNATVRTASSYYGQP